MGASDSWRRFVVMALAIATLGVAIGAVTEGGSALRIAIYVCIMIVSFLGFIGAYKQDATYLSYFLVLLAILFAVELAYIIYLIVKNTTVHAIIWEITEVCLLGVGAIFTYHLHSHITGYSPIDETRV